MDSFENFEAWFDLQIKGPWRKAKQDATVLSKSSLSLSLSDGLILAQLAHLQNGGRWIELGTLTGFSAMCLMSGLTKPEARLWTVEKDPECTRISTINLSFDSRIKVIHNSAMLALKTLKSLGPFDGIFFDATKSEYGEYFQWAEENLGPRGMIIADNIFLGERPKYLSRGVSEEIAPFKSKWSPEIKSQMTQMMSKAFDPTKYKTSLLPTSDGFLVAQKL